MLILSKSKLLFIGDSITDCGRERPIGEGVGLGNGYVSLVNALVAATYPQDPIHVVNTGIGGNTIRDLAARWQTDVLDLDPDWLSIMIGINDVWRQFDTPFQPEGHVSLDEYATKLELLIQTTLPRLKGLILMTPYFIESNKSDAMRMMMDQYGNAMRQLSGKFKTIFVDTQSAFDTSLQYRDPMSLAGDRIHPNQVGHMILARAFLKAVGYEW
jgi:lysophospholipase L1-like esterase